MVLKEVGPVVELGLLGGAQEVSDKVFEWCRLLDGLVLVEGLELVVKNVKEGSVIGGMMQVDDQAACALGVLKQCVLYKWLRGIKWPLPFSFQYALLFFLYAVGSIGKIENRVLEHHLDQRLRILSVSLQVQSAQDLVSLRELSGQIDPIIKIQVIGERANSHQLPEAVRLLSLREELNLARAARINVLHIVSRDTKLHEAFVHSFWWLEYWLRDSFSSSAVPIWLALDHKGGLFPQCRAGQDIIDLYFVSAVTKHTAQV